MKVYYVSKEHNAIADVSPGEHIGFPQPRAYVINRINVPKKHRGNGVASRLLQNILDDADEEGATLHLEINPSDGLTFRQLEAWYKRRGFEWSGSAGGAGFITRKPQRVTKILVREYD